MPAAVRSTRGALDVAEYFLYLAGEDFAATEPMTHLKLQKLVYYAQGFSLALRGVPLFDEPILAWQHGPVVREVFDTYRRYGRGPIPLSQDQTASDLDSESRGIIEHVYGAYGHHRAWTLREMTHVEAPYLNAPRNGVIERDMLREFFKRQLQVAKASRESAQQAQKMMSVKALTPTKRERIIQNMIATQALEGYTLSYEVAAEALEAAQRRPRLVLGTGR